MNHGSLPFIWISHIDNMRTVPTSQLWAYDADANAK